MGLNHIGPPRSGADLRSLRFFSSLSDAEAEQVLGIVKHRPVRRGSTTMLAREFKDRVGFVWSGAFRLIIAVPPKRTFSLAKLSRGEAFGHVVAFSNSHFGESLRLVCDEAGEVLEIELAHFAEVRRTIPALAEATLMALAKVASDQSGRLYELGVLNTRERIHAEILRLARDGEWRGRRSLIRPAPTHQELADQIGAAREVVTRGLRGMVEEGLIRCDRDGIEVLDVDKLLALDHAATGRQMFDPDRYVLKT